MYIYIYIHMYMYTYVCIYLYIYISYKAYGLMENMMDNMDETGPFTDEGPVEMDDLFEI